jgi:hypothetical protein
MTEYWNMALAGWREFQDWSPSTSILYPMLALSLICAVIVSMFTAASRLFTIPIGFMVLVFAANLSNFLGRDLFLSGITDLQKTMIFTILGNCVAALIVLAFFKVSERR